MPCHPLSCGVGWWNGSWFGNLNRRKILCRSDSLTKRNQDLSYELNYYLKDYGEDNDGFPCQLHKPTIHFNMFSWALIINHLPCWIWINGERKVKTHCISNVWGWGKTLRHMREVWTHLVYRKRSIGGGGVVRASSYVFRQTNTPVSVWEGFWAFTRIHFQVFFLKNKFDYLCVFLNSNAEDLSKNNVILGF